MKPNSFLNMLAIDQLEFFLAFSLSCTLMMVWKPSNSYFPESFTVGQNIKLTRNLFPLLFQFVLIVCDHTIDAEAEVTEEELAEKTQAETYMTKIQSEQNAIIALAE